MNSFINYVVQSAICLLIFYIFYFFFLKKETCFQYNRAYLFFSSALALVLPLIDFYALFEFFGWQQTQIIPTIYLPESSPADNGAAQPSQYLSIIVAGIYLIGFTFFLIRFLIQLITIRAIIGKNRYNIKFWNGCYLINTGGKLPTFSFFKYLFWDDSAGFSDPEKFQILNHELVHIRQKHSYDVLYFEMLRVLFWFNPIVNLYKEAVTDTHEYIADNEVIKNTNVTHYGHLIVRQLFVRTDLAIGSYFNKSQAYRRLNMMKINGKKTSFYKLLISLPLVVGLTFMMGFSVEQRSTAAFVRQNLPGLGLDQITAGSGESTSPGQREQSQAISGSGLEKSEGTGNKRPGAPSLIRPNGPGQDGLSPQGADDNIDIPGASKDEIFTIVEQAPHPIGGMKVFYSYISKNLKYPKQARRMGIEGKVFVQFVVDSDGGLSDITVIKGIGAGCDEEAANVVRNANRWNPGYQRGTPVKVRMVIPITFKLDKT
ncbi:M56 family metallopeptidase [Fulvivirgaceae bacterium BMA12]|uniref:M56 family metallopeptidase n=1 Tax=Agaribacillus aureus TaxID=3051825 RepID=A0ABT8KZX6_9BACT|nr:M56 family metallopeptidase [Fulvivirgaceae bacterium BMA12]